MRPNSKQYAKALYDLTKDADKKEIKTITAKFAAILAENNQLSREKSINDHFSRIWNREKEIVEAEIISARNLDKGILSILKDFIEKRFPEKKVIISSSIDEDIKGGFIIRSGDKVLDASLNTKMNDLKSELSK